MTSSEALAANFDGVQIIGIDCAAKPEDFGLARGRVRGRTVEIVEVDKGKGSKNCLDHLVKQVRCWIYGKNADRAKATLLALDAPLGWPIQLTRALRNHTAGAPLGHPSDASRKDRNPGHHLFRRHTDRFIAQKFPGAPLDIGADRIARVARSALELLGRLGTTGDGQSAVPLLWDSRGLEGLGAIEVYPRLTLRHLRSSQEADLRYKRMGKGSEHAQASRREIVHKILPTRLSFNENDLRLTPPKGGQIDYDHDRIDAVLCVLEGLHFLLAESVGPEHPEAAAWLAEETGPPTVASVDDIQASEGWIWFHQEEDPQEGNR